MGLLDRIGQGLGLEAPDAYQGPTVDPSAYAYAGDVGNGTNGGLFAQRQTSALGREAKGINTSQADADYQRALQDRAGLGGLVGQYQGVINGTAGPSVAEMQGTRQLEQAQQQGEQLAASARGTGQIAASREAILGSTLAGQRAAADAATLRAQEIEAARRGLSATYAQQAGIDQASRVQSFGQAQQAVSNDLAQQGINNGLAGTYLGGQLHAADSATQGAQAGAAAQTAAEQHAADVNFQAQQASAGRLAGLVGGALNAAAGGATGGLAGGLMGGGSGGGGAPADPYAANPYR